VRSLSVAVAAIGILVGFAIASHAGLVPVVLSVVFGTSMLPTLHPGDIVVCAKWVRPRIGGIYIVVNHGVRLVHRIIAIRDHLVITKGDNNPYPDPPVPIKNVVCGVVAVIPVELWAPAAALGIALSVSGSVAALARRYASGLRYVAVALAVAISVSTYLGFVAMHPIPPVSLIESPPAATFSILRSSWRTVTVSVWSNGVVEGLWCSWGRPLNATSARIVVPLKVATEAVKGSCEVYPVCRAAFRHKGVTWVYSFRVPVRLWFDPSVSAKAFYNASGTYLAIRSRTCVPVWVTVKWIGHEKRFVATCGVYRVSEKKVVTPMIVVFEGCGSRRATVVTARPLSSR